VRRAQPTVLVTTDFSPGSAAALAELEKFWPKGTRLHVHLVHVLEPLPYRTPPAQFWIGFERERERDTRRALDEIADRLRQRLGPQVHVEMHLPTGAAHQQVCRLAEKLGVDMIVTGTHGRTGLQHMLIGSVAERIVRHARRPVLTVPLSKRGRR
jgi:universal stress protein A